MEDDQQGLPICGPEMRMKEWRQRKQRIGGMPSTFFSIKLVPPHLRSWHKQVFPDSVLHCVQSEGGFGEKKSYP